MELTRHLKPTKPLTCFLMIFTDIKRLNDLPFLIIVIPSLLIRRRVKSCWHCLKIIDTPFLCTRPLTIQNSLSWRCVAIKFAFGAFNVNKSFSLNALISRCNTWRFLQLMLSSLIMWTMLWLKIGPIDIFSKRFQYFNASEKQPSFSEYASLNTRFSTLCVLPNLCNESRSYSSNITIGKVQKKLIYVIIPT